MSNGRYRGDTRGGLGLHSGLRIVRPGGVVVFNRKRYQHPQLKGREGQRVPVFMQASPTKVLVTDDWLVAWEVRDE